MNPSLSNLLFSTIFVLLINVVRNSSGRPTSTPTSEETTSMYDGHNFTEVGTNNDNNTNGPLSKNNNYTSDEKHGTETITSIRSLTTLLLGGAAEKMQATATVSTSADPAFGQVFPFTAGKTLISSSPKDNNEAGLNDYTQISDIAVDINTITQHTNAAITTQEAEVTHYTSGWTSSQTSTHNPTQSKGSKDYSQVEDSYKDQQTEEILNSDSTRYRLDSTTLTNQQETESSPTITSKALAAAEEVENKNTTESLISGSTMTGVEQDAPDDNMLPATSEAASRISSSVSSVTENISMQDTHSTPQQAYYTQDNNNTNDRDISSKNNTGHAEDTDKSYQYTESDFSVTQTYLQENASDVSGNYPSTNEDVTLSGDQGPRVYSQSELVNAIVTSSPVLSLPSTTDGTKKKEDDKSMKNNKEEEALEPTGWTASQLTVGAFIGLMTVSMTIALFIVVLWRRRSYYHNPSNILHLQEYKTFQR